MSAEDLLRNLLAVVHRDGGHHTEAVGLDQSVEDAIQVYYRLQGLDVLDPNALDRALETPGPALRTQVKCGVHCENPRGCIISGCLKRVG